MPNTRKKTITHSFKLTFSFSLSLSRTNRLLQVQKPSLGTRGDYFLYTQSLSLSHTHTHTHTPFNMGTHRLPRNHRDRSVGILQSL